MKTPAEIEAETGIAPESQYVLMGAETLAEAIGLSVGRASTCWRPDTGDAVFDSAAANVVVDHLTWWVENYIQDHAPAQQMTIDDISITDDISIEGIPTDEQYERSIQMDCRGQALIAAASAFAHSRVLHPGQLIDDAQTLEQYIRTGEAPSDSLTTQVTRLAQVIMREIPREPSRGDEGAIDCAIRLLRSQYSGEVSMAEHALAVEALAETAQGCIDGVRELAANYGAEGVRLTLRNLNITHGLR